MLKKRMGKNNIKLWIQQIRGPFLILSVALVLIGIAAAHRDGYFEWWHSIFLLIGVISAHISVNLFNEVSDFKTKIDEILSQIYSHFAFLKYSSPMVLFLH